MPRIPAGMRKTAKGGYESRFTIECRDRELARRREIEDGVYKPGCDPTLNQYYKIWENARLGTVRESTIRTNRYIYRLISEVPMESGNGCFGALSPGKIERQQLKQVQLVLSRDHIVSTVNKCMSLIRTVLEAAQEEGMIVRNPAKRLRNLRETKNRRGKRFTAPSPGRKQRPFSARRRNTVRGICRSTASC